MGPEDGEFPEDADGHRECRQEIDRLTLALAERRGREEALRIALLAKMKMEGRGNLHAKLDDALSWTENDELAEKLAQAALAAATPPQGGMSRKCDEYYQPDNCINTGTRPELMCEECLIAELPRIRTENAALTQALAESREKIDNAQEMAIATHKSVCGCLDWRENVRCQAMYKIAAAFALATPTPPQQEKP